MKGWLRAFFRVKPPATPRPRPRYSDADLLAQAEEFNQNAEAYWAEVASDAQGRRHALNKPFGTVADAVNTLYRVGLVLHELRLGVGFTVLDFGAGGCWLSGYLNRLGCHTVSIDVSPTALSLGQALFALDPRHRPELEPRFLPYDGHRIPLAAEAVDRIVCFDAFHHVPNQDEVLAEMYRVLRPGGRVVLAEPGEGHSHADHSVHEAERFGVLENDLDLEALVAKVRAVGFSAVHLKPYPAPQSLSLGADEYLRLMNGEHALYPLATVIDDLRRFHLLTLTKGEETLDSRGPGILKAQIEASPRELRGRAGQACELRITLENRGDTRWLHARSDVGGFVVLAGHLYDAAGRLARADFVQRQPLPRDVAPGESVALQLDVRLPNEPGNHTLRLDLVDDQVIWFSQVGSPTRDVALFVEPAGAAVETPSLRAGIELVDLAGGLSARAGTAVTLRLRCSNTGALPWRHSEPLRPGSVSFGAQLLAADGSVLQRDLMRCSLGADVAPGETVDVSASFRAPLQPGAYRLKLDLVLEHMCWFEERGSPPLELALDVPDVSPDSRDPGVLRAAFELLAPAEPWLAASGAAFPLRMRVTNAGNTVWLAGAAGERGQVALGAHLYDATGALLELDFLRAPLPAPLAPGESAEIAATVTAPTLPGRYQLELDLVDEGICWFASVGSTPLRRALGVS